MTTPQPAALPELVQQAIGFYSHSPDGQYDEIALQALRHFLAALQSQPAAAGVSDAALQAIDDAHDWQTTAGRMAAYRAILALRPQSGHPDSYEDIWQALMDINTAAVMLPEFNVRHEGGIKEATKNIVEAIEAASLRPQAVPMTDEVKEKALDLLAMVFDAYENGVPCHEENGGGYIGMAFNLDNETFHACADILNAHRPKAHHGITAQGAQGEQG